MRFLFLSRIAIPARRQDTRLAMRWVELSKYGQLTTPTLNRYRPACPPGRRAAVGGPDRLGWGNPTRNSRRAAVRTGRLEPYGPSARPPPTHRWNKHFPESPPTSGGTMPHQRAEVAAVDEPGAFHQQGFPYAEVRCPLRPSGREGTACGGLAQHASATRVSVSPYFDER